MAEGELCPDPSCEGNGELRVIAGFVRELPPGEREPREQLYREAGTIDRQTIMRALLGEFSC